MACLEIKATFSSNQSRYPRRLMATVAPSESPSSFYWSTIESDVQSYIHKAIPLKSPETVFEPMRHLTFAAPITTASSLCVAACEFVGGDRNQAIAAAAALHLVHAGLYTHYHLPLTDRKTPQIQSQIQHKYGPNIELLYGDGIIPFGVELLASSMNGDNQDRVLEAIIEISRCIGSQGMIDGQYRKLKAMEQSDGDEIHEYVIKKMEGEIHACGGACGAILGGAAEEEIERMRRFGMFMGMVKGMTSMKSYLDFEERIGQVTALALKELEDFVGGEPELISSLVHYSSI